MNYSLAKILNKEELTILIYWLVGQIVKTGEIPTMNFTNNVLEIKSDCNFIGFNFRLLGVDSDDDMPEDLIKVVLNLNSILKQLKKPKTLLRKRSAIQQYTDVKHLKQDVKFIEGLLNILSHAGVGYVNHDVISFVSDLRSFNKMLVLNVINENFGFDPFVADKLMQIDDNSFESEEIVEIVSKPTEEPVWNYCLESILNLIMLIKFFVISFFRNESDEDEEEEKFYASSVLNNVEEPGVQYPSDSLWEWNCYSTNLCLLCSLRNIFSNSLDLLTQFFSQAREELIDLYRNENQNKKNETGNSCRTIALYSDRSPKIIVTDELKDILKRIVIDNYIPSLISLVDTPQNACRIVAIYYDRSPKSGKIIKKIKKTKKNKKKVSKLERRVLENHELLKAEKLDMLIDGLKEIHKFRKFKSALHKFGTFQRRIIELTSVLVGDFIISKNGMAYDDMDELSEKLVDFGLDLTEQVVDETIENSDSYKVSVYVTELRNFFQDAMQQKREGEKKLDSFWSCLVSRFEDEDLAYEFMDLILLDEALTIEKLILKEELIKIIIEDKQISISRKNDNKRSRSI